MKYAIIIPDGCADEPIGELGNRTPLQAANIPEMRSIAVSGVCGLACHTPPHLPAGSEVANLSLLGYDPDEYFTGRAPLEAAAQGIELGPHDWAIRCNLVTVIDQIMVDFTADHVSTAEATELLCGLQEEVGSAHLRFHPGVSYRNLLLFRGSAENRAPFQTSDTRSRAPHDLTDLSVMDEYPRGPGSDLLVDLMERSVGYFAKHPVNAKRIAAGKKPVTNIWLWGLGRTPVLPPFTECYGPRGAMITAVDLLRGIASLIGWPRIEVPGATGYLDTDYRAKGRFAVEALGAYDLVCVHIEATDEASHEGRHDAKIRALEEIDQHIVGPIHAALKRHGNYRILVTPDHPTPCGTKKHSHGQVPFAVCGKGVVADQSRNYDEAAAAETGFGFDKGSRMMEWFIR
jgi:2,3-bisphosphoglycerate-independent phosphoglycerate mutase